LTFATIAVRAAVLRVDVLDDLFAAVVLDVEVDVRPAPASLERNL